LSYLRGNIEKHAGCLRVGRKTKSGGKAGGILGENGVIVFVIDLRKELVGYGNRRGTFEVAAPAESG